MKLLQKIKKYWIEIIFVAILTGALGVRLYNFPNRIIYGPEQARSLVTSAEYITNKFSLLGQEYFRVTTSGHKLFYGATWNYSLVPLLVLFKYDVFWITVYFCLLNILTGVCLFIVTLKIFNKKVALVASGLFLFNDYMIYHSLFLWPYNYLPLLGLLSFYLIYLFKNRNKPLYPFLLGLFSGFGFSLQYLYLPYILISLFFLMKYGKKKRLILGLFLIGFVVADLPMILFDLRHDYYNLLTLLQFLIDTLRGTTNVSFNYYYLLPVWPVVALGAGYLFIKYLDKKRPLLFLFLIIYLWLNLNSGLVDFSKSLGMPEGLTWEKILSVSETISRDNPKNFNLVSLLDFDTRGYILRYPVKYIYWNKPLGVEDYEKASVVYALAENDYNFINSEVWELKMIFPYRTVELKKLDSRYSLYKLVRYK